MPHLKTALLISKILLSSRSAISLLVTSSLNYQILKVNFDASEDKKVGVGVNQEVHDST